MTDFRTWSHANLVKFAEDSNNEMKHLREDLRTAINAYRALLKELHDTPNLQQLPTQQVQPDGGEHPYVEWNQIPLDLPNV